VRYQFRPLGPWPGPATPPAARRKSPFRVSYPATLELLWRETELLGAHDLVLQADIAERDIRADGLPRANARYGTHPGAVVTFGSAHGPLRYAADAFTDWHGNLRAIALALEALRSVDRYGVTGRGEQYTGWRALPPGSSPASPFATADEALAWMRIYYGADRGDPLAAAGLTARELHRRLAKMTHPDASCGDREGWDRLVAARQLLARAGLL
jgi:hypothetical protein